MNVKRFTVIAFVLVLMLAALPTAPQSAVAQEGDCPTAKDSYVIGFANLTEDIVFTQLVREGLVATAEEMGNVELILADNRLDGATALSNTENFLTQGVDAIIHFQTDEVFGNVIMARARGGRRSGVRDRYPHAGRDLLRRGQLLCGPACG